MRCGKKKKESAERAVRSCFPFSSLQPLFFPLLLPLDFFIVFLGRFCLVLGISFLHSKKNIEACDYEVEEGGLGARVHEMHPAPMDTAPEAKRTTTTTTTETKTSEKKQNIFLCIYLNSPSPSLPHRSLCCQYSFCAQRSEDYIATIKKKSRKAHNSQVLGRRRRKNSTLSIISLSV